METLWNSTCSLASYPRLQENIRVPAAVIGGGLAGILTAYRLKQLGIDCVILEASEIASGQTCRTTAKITSQHSLIYDRLIQTAGLKKAQQYALANEQAIADYKDLIQSEHISCHFKELPAYLYSCVKTDTLLNEMDAASRLGIHAEFVTDTPLPFPVKGALCYQHQAQFHPLEFIKGLLPDLRIYEHTPVIEVEGNTLQTKDATIQADAIIFTSHFPFLNIPGYFFTRVHQSRSYVLALEHTEDVQGMYLGIDSDGISLRNHENLLLLGGQGHRTGENTSGGQYRKLRQTATDYWPQSHELFHWSAQDCMTADQIPFIGNYSSSTPDWYVATGFQKWGMTTSMLAANLISHAIAGKECPYREVFSPARFPLLASAKTLLKDSTKAIAGLTKELIQLPDSELQSVRPGHGTTITYQGEKVGVYKDKDQSIHMVSTKCPHLGCQLEWNPEERTWDCPCHGSRFDYHGNVLDNPAQKGIAL